MRPDLEERLIEQLRDTHKIESKIHRMLDSMIAAVEEPRARKVLERHRLETRHHKQRLVERLQAHGESVRSDARAGNLKNPTLAGGSAETAQEQRRRPQRQRRRDDTRDSLLAMLVKIASYEMLEATAARAGDQETAQVARWNRVEEESLVRMIAAHAGGPEDLGVPPEGTDH